MADQVAQTSKERLSMSPSAAVTLAIWRPVTSLKSSDHWLTTSARGAITITRSIRFSSINVAAMAQEAMVLPAPGAALMRKHLSSAR